MSEWTPSAKAELETYFRRLRPPLEQFGADATEVIEDLRRHLDEEVAASKLTVVTEEDVRRLLNRIGGPEALPPAKPEPSAPAPAPKAPSAPSVAKRPSLWLLIFGVVLPAFTLAIEGVTAMCAEALFEPIPTGWHGLLLALVPLANGMAWFALVKGQTEWRNRLGWANGVAMGISLFYAIIFLPLVPPGLPGVLFFGFGLLPLTPMLALIATVGFRTPLRRLGADGAPGPLPGLWQGIAIGFIALLLLELPVAVTRLGMKMAVAEDVRILTGESCRVPANGRGPFRSTFARHHRRGWFRQPELGLGQCRDCFFQAAGGYRVFALTGLRRDEGTGERLAAGESRCL